MAISVNFNESLMISFPKFYFYHINPDFHHLKLKVIREASYSVPSRYLFSFLFTLLISAKFISLKYTLNMSPHLSKTLISFLMPFTSSLNSLG